MSNDKSRTRFRIAMILVDDRDMFGWHDLLEPRFGSAPTALLEGFSGKTDLEVHIVSCVRGELNAPERLAENIFYHALRVPQWGFLRTGYLPCIQRVRQKLRQIEPNVVHGQGTERYQALVAAYSGFPNLVTIHGNMRQIARALGARPFSFHWFAARLEPLAIRRTAGVICLSLHTYKQVHKLARQIWNLPNAAQQAFFEVPRAPDPVPVVLCVANIAPYKNQNFLMRALDPIASSTGMRLVFLGRTSDGVPYSEEFRAMVQARPWCSHAGFQNGAALRNYFRTAHLLVLPTLEDNCPMVILEAMAAGLPVAAARTGGIPQMIQDGANGVLFDPRDSESLRNTVLGLIRDQSRAVKLAENARKNAQQQYHPETIARRHIEIYKQICGNPRSR